MNFRHIHFNLAAALLSILAITGCGAQKGWDEIVIYYDNDAHCFVDGYATAAQLKREAIEAGKYSALVSSGDFIQGASLGASTKGGAIIDILNAADYDVVTLGNHEFDYGIPRLKDLAGKIDASIVDCNLYDLQKGRRMFAPFRIMRFGKTDVAFIGVTTPYAFVSSVPSYFQDEDGNYIYSLSIDNIFEVVQSCIDRARKKGAEYVVVLSHLGDNVAFDAVNSHTLIENTTGIDVVLDGHAHSYIPCETYTDKAGKEVILTSTGSYLQNIGRLAIHPDGTISTSMVPVASVEGKDAKTLEAIRKAKEEYDAMGSRVVGRSEVELIFDDEDSPRIVRERESGLGDFCADALRLTTGTEISMIGGGSIRAGLPEGPLTYNDLFTLFPFRNTVGTAMLTGQQILDILEFAVAALPMEFGGFQQVSGLKFEVDVQTDTPVSVDEKKVFDGFVSDRRRVFNVQVLGKDGSYAPIEKDRKYSVAASTYMLVEHGDGFDMFGDTKVLDTGILDLDILDRYLNENLGGVIPARYKDPEGRITIHF